MDQSAFLMKDHIIYAQKSQKKSSHLLPDYKEVNTGPYGGVDPLQNGKSEKDWMGGTGGRRTGLPSERE
jgi:hypothetical protein